ncbi:MAG: hypothetical protein E3J72_03825 [Planctomycetota bacterium]|nr:MAG: hypothetical protein E3J72_03825 [Planctomycetota bacterium]
MHNKIPKYLLLETIIIIACAVIMFMVLLPAPDQINELYAAPDMIEYGTGAANLARTGEYFIWVGHKHYPPMYPFGFAIFQYPFLKVSGAEVENVRYGLVFSGVAAIILIYLAGRYLWGVTAGVIAALLFAASPVVAIYSRLPMTEAPFILVFVAVLVLGFYVAGSGPGWKRNLGLVGLGALVGLGTVMRLNALIFGFPVAALVIIAARRKPYRLLADCGLLAIGVLPFALSAMAYNRAHYGGCTRTGYAYWASYIHDDPGKVWGSQYAFKGARNKPEVSNLGFAVKSALVLTSPRHSRAFRIFWLPCIAILGLAGFGLVRLFRRRVACRGKACLAPTTDEQVNPLTWLLLIAGTNLLLTVIMLFYFYQDGRFHFTWLPIVFLLAGVGMADLINRARESRWRSIAPVSVCVLLALFCIAYLYGAVRQANKFSYVEPIRYETIKKLRDITEDNAVIVSDMYGPYISYWLIAGTNRDHVPFRYGHSRQYVMPTRPERTPRAEYVFAMQLVHKSKIERHVMPLDYVGEIFPEKPGPDSLDEAVALGAEALYDFSAATSPEKIAEYLEQGRPVYLETTRIPVEKVSKEKLEEILKVRLQEIARPARKPIYRLSIK